MSAKWNSAFRNYGVLLAIMLSPALFFLTSCHKKTSEVNASVKEAYFIIGSGGGVAGRYEQFKVYQHGGTVRYDFENKYYLPYSTLSTRMNAEIWEKLKAIKITSLSIDDPGNFTYYVELIDNDKSNKVIWNDETDFVPSELKSFFNLVEKTLKNTN